MKLKRRRYLEVPHKIRAFVNTVTSVPLENIEEPLKSFVWEFDKGDFHHWVELFNHFDSFFEKHVKSRKDLQVEDNFFGADPPFPREAVLQILRVIRIILENCTNKHFYSSYEQHLSYLLGSTDADVVEACLQTLAAFLKKTIGKYSIRDASLNSKLFSLAQGWGGKEEGLGLIACAVQDGCDALAYELGCTLHFEFYASNGPLDESLVVEKPIQGLQIIHLPSINTHPETDLEILSKLVVDYKVRTNLRFSLLSRLRFARAFGSLPSRQQYTCIRLYAFTVLVQASSDSDDLVSFLKSNEPEFINELVTLLSYEDAVPEKIRSLCLHSLVALCQDRTRQPNVLTAVTSGGHRGILSSLMQKAIDSVINKTEKFSVMFVEALLSLVTVLVSSSSGCAVMREAGLIPTLLPLLKDTDPQHLHLVSTAVHILEAFMDYSDPAAALFRDLGGLDDTISRLKLELSYVESISEEQGENPACSGRSSEVLAGTSCELDGVQAQYSEALVSYQRRLLMKALLHAISLETYASGNSAHIYGSEENLLPNCLCIIFRRAKDFGGGVFSLAATVMSDLIHKDPTCFSVLDAAGLPSAFLDAIMDGTLCSSDAITCIPQCLDALCLNANGLQAVKDRNALRCFVKIFTSRIYSRALTGDTPGSLSSGLDELMRHASSLREPGVDMMLEILNTIWKIGSGCDGFSPESSGPVPMETDTEERNLLQPDDRQSSRTDYLDQAAEPSTDASLMNIEQFLPDCINNVARLLETILQNADTCRMFVEKKGIDAVLQLFTLPLMPISASSGHGLSLAFKNFSPQHSVSLARAVCSFLREHLKSTNEILCSIQGSKLGTVESVMQTKILRYLSSLEGLLSLSSFLLKGSASILSELSTADADLLKDLGRVYREVIWQIALCNDSMANDKKNADQEPEVADTGPSNAISRESDDDGTISSVRYMNPVSVRIASQSVWGGEHEFLPVIRSGEGLHRRSRHGLSRIRGRTSRHLEALNFDFEVPPTIPDSSSFQDIKKKSPDVLAIEILNKIAFTLRSFFTALVKGFTSPNRRRAEIGSLSSASKTLGMALARVFLEALSFSGYSSSSGLDMSLPVKCRYLGKVVDGMGALTFDNRRRTCFTAMVNNFYVHGTFKELLTTFEATSQLLWTLPFSIPASSVEQDKAGERNKPSHAAWLLDTLQNCCRVLEYFVNSTVLLSPNSASQSQLLVQPVAAGLSIGLFPVPRDPEAFIRMLQGQVLEAILPIWNHPMLPSCNPAFVSSIVLLVTRVYSGTGDVKQIRSGMAGSSNQRIAPPPPDEATIATIVEMGFSRSRAEEALRRVETNSVEMAMEWLCNHAEDPVQEDDELARALALSLGSSSEASKSESVEKPMDAMADEGQTVEPPIDHILKAILKLIQNSDSISFSLTDLLVTLCNRNKGEDRPKVAAYLVQQLKLCPLDFSTDNSSLCMISHIIAVLLSEDGKTVEIVAQHGIIPAAVDILMHFKHQNESRNEIVVPKCISALLLILDNMLQPRPKILADATGGTQIEQNSLGEHASQSGMESALQTKMTSDFHEKETVCPFEKILGRSTGCLTTEESNRVMLVACDLIKQHVPALVMQATLQVCARLTKTHSLALQFLENGGLAAVFSLPRTSFFPGYDSVVSAIVRHLLEDPQTLQTAMELEIRQYFSGNRHGGRVSVRTFLTSMAPVFCRDPAVFLKVTAAVCQLESSGGRTFVVLCKEKEKEKDKSKALGLESSNEPVRISEGKTQDGSVKCSKGQKRIPANLTQVIDQLLEMLVRYTTPKSPEDCPRDLTFMEVDEPAIKVVKGKSKVDESVDMESESQKSAGLAKVTFVLKLLSDILLMYVHAVSVILKRDSEMCQPRASNNSDASANSGILHHILHILLPPSIDKSAGSDEFRAKLSEKASWFLVVLCGRSNEGRKRVINELVKALNSFANLESNSMRSTLVPAKKIFAFCDLAYSILSKNSASSNLPCTGYSPDIAKSMIEGGMVQCLSSILQVLDLDHPDAPKIVNLILKALESLTRAANANEQVFKSDAPNRRKPAGANDSQADQIIASARETLEHNEDGTGERPAAESGENAQQQHHGISQSGSDSAPNESGPAEHRMRAEVEETAAGNQQVELGMDFMREDVEDGAVLPNTDQIEMTFTVENRAEDEMGEEDDDMADDGEDEEDDDDGDDDDEDIAEDGAGVMLLADTDVEDHDDTGLGDDYNDDMIDEDDDEFHENRVIEVRWREALDGLDHLQALGQSEGTSGLIDVAAEPFEGVNVDDLFGLRRPLGFERRRQSSRSSYERSVSEVNGFQHPLLLRPSQSGDLVSVLSSGGSSSRDLEAFPAGSFDVAHFYFDTPVLHHDHTPSNLFGDRLGTTAPPPLADYSARIDTLHLQGRRGPSDTRWTDDGQPQAGGQAAAIAQAVEEQFLCRLSSIIPSSNLTERQSQNSGVSERQPSEAPPLNESMGLVEGDHDRSLHIEDEHPENGNEITDQLNPTFESGSGQDQMNLLSVIGDGGECPEPNEGMVPQLLSLNGSPDVNLEIGESNTVTTEQEDTVPELVSLSVGCHSDLQSEPGTSLPVNTNSPVDIHTASNSAFGSGGLPAADEPSNPVLANSGLEMANGTDSNGCRGTVDVDMNVIDDEGDQNEQTMIDSGTHIDDPAPNSASVMDANQADQTNLSSDASGANAIDPTFLEALPEDLRAEVLASQQAQSVQPPTYVPPSADDIDPEFLAALPPEIQAEVLAQQRAQRIAQQAEGQPVDMDNASIIATLPADLREEVLLTSSEADLSALPYPLLAEAQMLRDRAMSHYQARSLFGGSHRLSNRRNGLGLDRQTVMDRGVGVTLGRRTSSVIADSFKVKEIEGDPLLDPNSLKALIRLLRVAQPLGKGLLQRLLLNLCSHTVTRARLVRLLLDLLEPEGDGSGNGLPTINSQRLYGCQSNVVYGRSQLLDGLPPLVFRRALEILCYLATNHSAVANMLFYFDNSILPESMSQNFSEMKKDKAKEKVIDEGVKPTDNSQGEDVPLILFLKLLDQPLCLRSSAHLEQVVGLLQIVVYTAASKLESRSLLDAAANDSIPQKADTIESSADVKNDQTLSEQGCSPEDKHANAGSSASNGKNIDVYDIFLKLPQSELSNLCSLLGHEGLSEKVCLLAGEVLKKLASVAEPHRKFFTSRLSELSHSLCGSAVTELVTLRNTQMLGLSACSMAGAAILRVLQVLSSLAHSSVGENSGVQAVGEQEEQATLWKLNVALEPLWQELSDCISVTEAQMGQTSLCPPVSSSSVIDHVQGTASSSSLPPGTQRLLPLIEAFFVLCEKLHANNPVMQQDHLNVTAREVKESAGSSSFLSKCGGDSQKKLDGSVTFVRFSEKHRRLLNAFIRQNPGLLEKSLSMMLKAPRLIDFDNKRAYFRSRIRQQHDQHLSGPLRISVRRAYVLEDSYNQLRMRPSQDLKGRLNVQFQGEEGIDAGGLTREWYQLLSRVIFDKGALLFTTVGNNATFQPNPNSVYQTEHISYFKFAGRVVAKALFDGQLLDVYFTRSFYKHILGVKVTYHDIEAVDPDYYKNLKWMLENDVSDIPALTFSMDPDEEKHILYEKTEVTDYELKPGGRNIRVTEETKHEYVDLVADHILTNAIRPQINSFLDGFTELVPRELISIFNDKELELLISGLPEIDLDDLKANTEYTGYTIGSPVIQWFWEVVKAFSKEDMARFLQFVTGTSKVPLEGFKALQGISGPQRFQIHKAYGTPDRLPSAHTCFNQLDLPEYTSKEQLQERLLLAIHEASEGFGFG